MSIRIIEVGAIDGPVFFMQTIDPVLHVRMQLDERAMLDRLKHWRRKADAADERAKRWHREGPVTAYA